LGKVAQIFPSAEGETRQIRVEIEVDGKESLPLGSFARAHFSKTISTGNAIIPLQSVLDLTGEKPFIFIVENGTAKKVFARLGQANGTHIEVLEPLKGGEQVVVEGQNYLADGAKVRVVEEGNSSGEPPKSTETEDVAG